MKTAKLRLQLLSLLGTSLLLAAAENNPKKIIEFGWDEPGTDFMRQQTAQMERTPFDGCVFHVDYLQPDGRKGSFTWEAWGERAFAENDLAPALENLQAVSFRRLTNNFLRFNTTPAKLDWFDDHAAVLTNAYQAARLAAAGPCRGLLFDIEQYDGQLFDYRKQKETKTKSWEMYAWKTRQRGREVMAAFQAGYPGLTVFLTFGYSLPWAESEAGKKALADCHYGLLAPFLDGMLEAARGKTILVDGHELSYGYKDTNRFGKAYQTMNKGLLPIVRDAKSYNRFFSFGFGLWLDHDWRKKGWNTDDPSQNFFTPEAFEASVRTALETADEYIWIYTETPRWWSPAGEPVKLPAAYRDALRQARKGLIQD